MAQIFEKVFISLGVISSVVVLVSALTVQRESL